MGRQLVIQSLCHVVWVFPHRLSFYVVTVVIHNATIDGLEQGQDFQTPVHQVHSHRYRKVGQE